MANVKQAVKAGAGKKLMAAAPAAPMAAKAAAKAGSKSAPEIAVPTPPKPDAEPAKRPPTAADMMQELKVTGHMMALPVGLFCIINETNHITGRSGGMPGVRISPPPQGSKNVEIVGFRPDGWLSADGEAMLVRISNAPAQVLVTIYQQTDSPESAPKIQVRQLLSDAPQPAQSAAAAPQQRFDMLAHIQTRGDVGAKFGTWLGEPGSQNWIEGFAIAVPEGIEAADLSYQAVLGRGWLSPWVEAGAYCGSRGMALPLLGLRVRLTGAAAEAFDVACSATFVGGTSAGPVGNDETCEGAELAPLEAFMVTLTPKVKKAGRGKR
jgi:hypothetical protein